MEWGEGPSLIYISVRISIGIRNMDNAEIGTVNNEYGDEMLYVSFVLFVYFVVENKDIISQEGHEEHEEIRQSIYAPEHLGEIFSSVKILAFRSFMRNVLNRGRFHFYMPMLHISGTPEYHPF